jgi:diacylglycerol kinase (ATP)
MPLNRSQCVNDRKRNNHFNKKGFSYMGKIKIIANPVAGSGAGGRAIPRIERLLKEQQLDYDLTRTEHPGHGIELTREAAGQGYDVVVAAGGDGTSNEVINGLMQAKLSGTNPPPMGVFCVGRGNDFAHGVDIPYDLEMACQVLKEDHRRVIDIGRVAGGKYPEGRYFGNCVGVGFDAITTIEVSKMPRFGGFFSFFIAVLKTIFLYYKGPQIRLEYDGQSLTQRCLLISVMNGQRLGGGFWMAPEAKPDDGLFDLCIAREASRRRIFSLIPYFMKGTQGTQEEITVGQASRIAITAIDGVLPAQTDGEILCVDGNHLEIELLPRQLEVVCCREGAPE